VTYRNGIGYDLHRTEAGRPLVLGGVRIPCEFGLIAHSDGDVVLHALCDALLGAAGLGDIGELFPDSDPRFKDADSREFVTEVLARIRAVGLSVVSADIIIHAQHRTSPNTSRVSSGRWPSCCNCRPMRSA